MNATLTVQPLPGAAALAVERVQPTIGAVVRGVDLAAPIDDRLRDEIYAALLQHKVLFFRDQELTPVAQARFAERFGPLYAPPGIRAVEGAPFVHEVAASHYREPRPPTRTSVESGYHTDSSWRLVPSKASLLRAVHVPAVGGDTIWVDTGAIYDALPEELKTRFAELHVTHDGRHGLRRAGHDYPIVAHPLVRTHPETGHKSLWVSFNQRPHIVGLDIAESRALLQFVLEQYATPEFQVRFAWRAGSVALWDNRATAHYGVNDYGDFPRLLHRVLIADERSYAAL